MKRSDLPIQLFVFAVAAVFALGVLVPTRYLGWMNDVASIVRLPTVPFGDMATRTRIWLNGGEPGSGDPRELAVLQTELDRYRSLYIAQKKENEGLQELIEQFQRARSAGIGVEFAPVAASITGKNSAGDDSSYILNIGSRKGVVPSCVAVFNGSHLIGRVSDVGKLTSTLVPITEESAGYIRATVVPSSSTSPRLGGRQPMTDLRGNDIYLIGDIDHEAGVEVGDSVYLDDPDWPKTAQSMILGTVREIRPKDNNPLLWEIVVQPSYSIEDIGRVTLKIEQENSMRALGGGG